MSILSQSFVVYEKLAAQKMNDLVASINSHNHDGSNGVQIRFEYLAGKLQTNQVDAGTITGAKIADNSIESRHIVNSTIVLEDINTNLALSNSLKVDGAGYAVYSA